MAPQTCFLPERILFEINGKRHNGLNNRMTVRLRELIRSVRQAKTAAEERNAIAKESAALREAFKNQDTTYQHRNVAKLMYIHMMGYPTHFGQMECLKLIAATSFPEKRIGYLGLMILLDERQEVLMLVTNSLKNDLNSRNQYIVGLALAALGNICSAEMARDLAPDIERLMNSSNGYIRKKAALCGIRGVKKVPDLVESYQEPAANLLNDRHHGVLLAGVSLMMEICVAESQAILDYRKHVPQLCRILKSLVVSGFSPDHDVGGINDPFLQVKILRLLRILGKGSAEASDQMSDILAQVATNTEPTRNAGNSILYECVQTIMGVESIGGLRVLAINILGKFLSNRDNNIRYVALNTLAKVVNVDAQAVQRHRATIVECVKDADVSIRKRALELVYSLVNEGNIKNLTKELLEYLTVSDVEFKPDLTSKICMLIQRFAPDRKWHIDSMIQVMVEAGKYVKEEMCNALIVLITNDASVHDYTVKAMFTALTENAKAGFISLTTVCTWCIGEFGELLTAGENAVSEQDVVDLLESVLGGPNATKTTREYVLTALMKLSAKFPAQVSRIKSLVEKFETSKVLEVQQRSCEYARIFKYEQMRPLLVERMPALDEREYAQNLGADINATKPANLLDNGEMVPNRTGQAQAMDLLGMDDVLGAPVSTSRNVLDDLLGTEPAVSTTSLPAQTTTQTTTTDLMDLLADTTPSVDTQQPPPQDPLQSLIMDAPIGSEASSHPPPTFLPITAYENGNFKIEFSFSKPAGQPSLTDITATYTNLGVSPVTDFALQAAVPKYMQLRLEPASGTTLPANQGQPVTQVMHVTNTQHEQKNLALRLRISATVNGAPVVEQCEVKNFPPGLR